MLASSLTQFPSLVIVTAVGAGTVASREDGFVLSRKLRYDFIPRCHIDVAGVPIEQNPKFHPRFPTIGASAMNSGSWSRSRENRHVGRRSPTYQHESRGLFQRYVPLARKDIRCERRHDLVAFYVAAERATVGQLAANGTLRSSTSGAFSGCEWLTGEPPRRYSVCAISCTAWPTAFHLRLRGHRLHKTIVHKINKWREKISETASGNCSATRSCKSSICVAVVRPRGGTVPALDWDPIRPTASAAIEMFEGRVPDRLRCPARLLFLGSAKL